MRSARGASPFVSMTLGRIVKQLLKQGDRRRKRVELAPGRLNSVPRAHAAEVLYPFDPSKHLLFLAALWNQRRDKCPCLTGLLSEKVSAIVTMSIYVSGVSGAVCAPTKTAPNARGQDSRLFCRS